MSTFIVTERSDGRGGIKPFNSYSAAQKGATVRIGDKTYKVTSDGRVNIPKAIMQKYGVRGDDGRRRIGIQFSAQGGKDGWKTVAAQIKTPPERAKNQSQGTVITRPPADGKYLIPADSGDFSWSPV